MFLVAVVSLLAVVDAQTATTWVDVNRHSRRKHVVERFIRKEPDGDHSSKSSRIHSANVNRRSLQVHPTGHIALEFSAAGPTFGHRKAEKDHNQAATEKGHVRKSAAAANATAVEEHHRLCGAPMYAPDGLCPEACPYTAEVNQSGSKACYFVCVKKEDCGKMGTREQASIGDNVTKTCRACMTVGCRDCAFGSEKCIKCMDGYELQADGTCWVMGDIGFSAFSIFGYIPVLVMVVYAIELSFIRVPTNKEGLLHGMSFRGRTVVKMPNETETPSGNAASSKDQLFPISTNIMAEQKVGGPGLCLHMRFQVFLIIWPIMLCVVYYALGKLIDDDLLVLGTKSTKPETESIDLCNLVRWGAQKTEQLNVIKLCYTFFAYLATVVSLLVFGILNEFTFRRLDSDHLTLKDFTAYLTGLPALPGTDLVEDEIQTLIEETTLLKTVGVSMCWDFAKDEEKVEMAHEQFAEHLEQQTDPDWQKPLQRPADASPTWHPWDEGGPSFLKGAFGAVDKAWRETMWGIPIAIPAELKAEEIKAMLANMQSTHAAYVVFESEDDRDKALEGFAEKTPTFRGSVLDMQACRTEPGAIIWSNYVMPGTTQDRSSKVLTCCMYIFLLIIVWTVVFYIPFAYYVASRIIASGQPSSPYDVNFWLLTGVVVLGNQLMYLICDLASTWCRFELEDEKQACYTVLYSIAVFICSIMDVIVTGYVTYLLMLSKDVHTADGRKLADLDNFQEIVESYPMQRAFGEALFTYAVPSTFILPFILEGVFGIGAVTHLAAKLVQSRPEMRGRKAEKALWYFLEMNMCRYGDLIFNVLLGTLVFFVAGGYTHRIFFWMAVGHVYIYLYDHWRIIRCTPAFCYSTQVIDWVSQCLMSLPCGIILGGTIFRWYEIFYPTANFGMVLALAALAALTHCAVHIFVILKVLPKLGHVRTSSLKGEYSSVARQKPQNFFSVNPVHCLRSRYIYKHDIPCSYYMKGKEYLMWANPELGMHFDESERPDLVSHARQGGNPSDTPDASPSADADARNEATDTLGQTSAPSAEPAARTEATKNDEQVRAPRSSLVGGDVQ